MKLLAAKLLLGPLLVWQGRTVRATALRLPEAAGPRDGQVGSGDARLRILIVGDSSAAGVGADHQAQALSSQLAQAIQQRLGGTVTWQLVAQSGHRTEDAVGALQAVSLSPADVLVTALGVNDVVDQVASSASTAALRRLDALARERAGVRLRVHCAAPPMHVFPLLPQPLRWFFGQQAAHLNASVAEDLQTDARRLLFRLPSSMHGQASELMAEDGFHPGPAGYRLWAESLAVTIVAALDKEKRPASSGP